MGDLISWRCVLLNRRYSTMMCKVPYSSCKVVTAHRESPQVPTVRLGGTVQYYAEQHGVQCHAVEHCGHESSSFSPVLQVLYRVKTLRREAQNCSACSCSTVQETTGACFYVVLTIRQENQIRGTEREQPSSMAGSLHPQ